LKLILEIEIKTCFHFQCLIEVFFWLGRIPVFMKHSELNQYILKYNFRWSLSEYILWLGVFSNLPSGFQYYWSIYIHKLANNAQEFKTLLILIKMWHKQKKRFFLSLLRFEPEPLGWITDAWAYFATLPRCHAATLPRCHSLEYLFCF
jgi:hypothetical protein